MARVYSGQGWEGSHSLGMAGMMNLVNGTIAKVPGLENKIVKGMSGWFASHQKEQLTSNIDKSVDDIHKTFGSTGKNVNNVTPDAVYLPKKQTPT
jgi:hypothetical protein